MGGKGWREAGGGGSRRVARARTRISLLPNIRSNAFLNEVSAAFPISTASASATLDSHAPATPDASPGNFLDEGTSRPRTRFARLSRRSHACARASDARREACALGVARTMHTGARAAVSRHRAPGRQRRTPRVSSTRAISRLAASLFHFARAWLAQRFRHRRNTALPLVRSSARGWLPSCRYIRPPAAVCAGTAPSARRPIDRLTAPERFPSSRPRPNHPASSSVERALGSTPSRIQRARRF
jgi:hypothetical protein